MQNFPSFFFKCHFEELYPQSYKTYNSDSKIIKNLPYLFFMREFIQYT